MIKLNKNDISESELQKAFDISVNKIVNDFEPGDDKEKALMNFLSSNMNDIIQ